MAVTHSTDAQKAAFGEALLAALMAAGLRPPDLVDVVSASTRDNASNLIKNWVSGKNEPPRPTVTAIEQFLNLEPGDLSRHLGWLPVGAAQVPTLEAAVLADSNLTGEQRRVLLQLLKSFRNA
ncbi:hypothetical protein UFOVP209_44 [uncultured Caudovirales phage]|uniref:Uncharacterized protein n=1 Tax=uncultured Caudovirales phage TaxID=2100421 RepID=A0A6J7WRR8_9CAUD|nr:hypothetical protein UFOVP209_44 [uncultured Caudovirales phage]